MDPRLVVYRMIRLLSLSLLVAVLAGCGQSDRRDAAPDASAAGSRADAAVPDSASGLAGDEIARDIGPPATADDGPARGPSAPGSAANTPPPVGPRDSGGDAPPESSSAAADILRRAERAYEGIRSMEADFVQRVTVPLLDQTQSSRGTIFHRRPDRFLMRFSDPEGDVIVADGRYLWMYYPSADPRQVLRSRLGAGGAGVDLQREFLSDADRRFAATHAGVEDVGGRPADVLRLIPREPSQYVRVTIWVDRQDAMVRRFEMVEQNESVRRLELRNLRPNVTLADDLFRFTPPPGAEVFDS